MGKLCVECEVNDACDPVCITCFDDNGRQGYKAGLQRAIAEAEQMHRELLPLEQSPMPLFQDACNTGAKSALTELIKRLRAELTNFSEEK